MIFSTPLHRTDVNVSAMSTKSATLKGASRKRTSPQGFVGVARGIYPRASTTRTELGQQIRQYAPHLFENEKSS